MTERVQAATKPLRLFAVYPGFDLALNEMALVLQRLADAHEVFVRVVAPMADALKGSVNAERLERSGNLEIIRVKQQFPILPDQEVLAAATEFRPDAILVGTRQHLKVGVALARALGVSLLLHTEYIFNDHLWVNRKQYLGLPPLRPLAGAWLRRRVLKGASLVLVADPLERHRVEAHSSMRYLPWPHPRPTGVVQAQAGRDTNTLLYIGSLFRTKGAERLAEYFCAALERIPDLQLRLIGPAVDSTGEAALARMRALAGPRMQYEKSVAREDAMRLIGNAFMVFSPGDAMGWGQIGDAWWRGTPVVAAREHYELKQDQNCLITRDAPAFVAAVTRLRSDAGLRTRLAEGGLAAVAGHDVGVVAQRIREILERL